MILGHESETHSVMLIEFCKKHIHIEVQYMDFYDPTMTSFSYVMTKFEQVSIELRTNPHCTFPSTLLFVGRKQHRATLNTECICATGKKDKRYQQKARSIYHN